MINIYKHKYLKYKFKYNKLKFQLGGNINRIEADKIYDTDPSIAFQLYQKAAEEGDIKSYYILSEMYKKGHGVEENLLESIKLYKIANIHTFNNFLVTISSANSFVIFNLLSFTIYNGLHILPPSVQI